MKMLKKILTISFIVFSIVILSSCEGLVSDSLESKTSTFDDKLELKGDYVVGYNWYVKITKTCSLYSYYKERAISSSYDTEYNTSTTCVPYIDENEEIYFPSKHFTSKNSFTTFGLSEKGICSESNTCSDYNYAYSVDNPYIYEGKFHEKGPYGEGGSSLEISNTIGFSESLVGANIFLRVILYNNETQAFHFVPDSGMNLTGYGSEMTNSLKHELKASRTIDSHEEEIKYSANVKLTSKCFLFIDEVKVIQMTANNEFIKEDIISSPENYVTEEGCDYIVICEKKHDVRSQEIVNRTLINKGTNNSYFSYLVFKENGFVENHTILVKFS